MATAVETIKNFMGVLRNYEQDSTYVGRIALDEAIRQTTMYSSLEDAVNKLKNKLADTTQPDTDTRLQEVTGMVLGASDDLKADTGAISGYNAGGSVVKNAADIVPETGDMSTATLPTPGSTTPITYTGSDGNSFTFYVKWPDSFTEVVEGTGKLVNDGENRLDNADYQIDLNKYDPSETYQVKNGTDSDGKVTYITSPTAGQMKSAIETSLKCLNTWWLREGAKLNYDSLGLALNGQTIEIKFIAGGDWDDSSAITFGRRDDYEPSNFITVAINISNYGRMDPNDANGVAYYANGVDKKMYLDRVVAHELVHAVMYATGTDKVGMPQFFTEGIADVVQGDDDDNANQYSTIVKLVNDSNTLVQGLSYLPGTGGDYNYAAGDMFLRFLAKQNLETTSIVGDSNLEQIFDYNGNNEVITNYVETDRINYNATFKDAAVSNTLNDIVITTNDDYELIVRDVRGKLMTFNTAAGDVYAYMSSNAGEVSGSNYNDGNNYEILFGANYENNILRAGNVGSFLWGGYRGDDVLYGGAGVDKFVYAIDGGHDIIHNAEIQDSVLLSDMELNQISDAQILDNGVSFKFKDGGTLNVNGQPATFTVDYDNKTTNYRADYQNKTWVQV